METGFHPGIIRFEDGDYVVLLFGDAIVRQWRHRPNMNNHPAVGDYPDRIVSAKERRRIVPYSDVHVGRLEKAGKFPKRIALGPGRNGWSLRELIQWVEEKKKQRDAANTEADAVSPGETRDIDEHAAGDRVDEPADAALSPP